MRTYAMTLAGLLTLGAVFILLSHLGSAQTLKEDSTNGVPHVSVDRLSITVTFSDGRSMPEYEIRNKAAEILLAKGYRMETRFHTVLTISVLGSKPGCAVIYEDLKASMLYIVEFDERGNAKATYTGPIRHGASRLSEPSQKVPDGGVSVKP